MKIQTIIFEKNEELSKKAQDKIIKILSKEKANNINIDFAKKRK